jgi:hypothetical protein
MIDSNPTVQGSKFIVVTITTRLFDYSNAKNQLEYRSKLPVKRKGGHASAAQTAWAYLRPGGLFAKRLD